MGYGGTALLMHTHVPSKSQRGPNLVGKFKLVRGGGSLSIKIQMQKKIKKNIGHISMEKSAIPGFS